MRTIEIDDKLMRLAMRCSGARTRKEAVEAGLRLLTAIQAQASIRRLRGKIHWEGSLDESRLGHLSDPE